MEPAQIKVMLEACKDPKTVEAWSYTTIVAMCEAALDYINQLEGQKVGQPLILG